MKTLEQIKIISMDFSKESQKTIEKILLGMEEPYCTEFYRRYIPMLEDKSLRETFVIFNNSIPIGIYLLREVDGVYFGEIGNVLRSTMFRILPSYRNMGIGKYAFNEINKIIFEKYKIDKIYSESKEFGAIKLYVNCQNVFIYPNQKTNNLAFDEWFLASELPNNFMLEKDIQFIISKSTKHKIDDEFICKEKILFTKKRKEVKNLYLLAEKYGFILSKERDNI